ncbi:MAG: hypothetical protein QOE10_2912 [Gaiellales bacterium]|nr:hypothetical protein [Gaiellales bacterium]
MFSILNKSEAEDVVHDVFVGFILCSKDCRTAGGVYLWKGESAAHAFMNERVAPMIHQKFQVDPIIEFYDSPVIVEN